MFSLSEIIIRSHKNTGGATMQPITAPRSLKEKQRQEREALILKAAEDVLMEKGYHETSIDEIAARVGIAKGTVYLHFPSKEDLVVAIFERDMQQLLQSIDSTLPTMVMLSAFYSLLSPKSYDRLMTEGQMVGEEVAKNLKRIYFKGISAN